MEAGRRHDEAWVEGMPAGDSGVHRKLWLVGEPSRIKAPLVGRRVQTSSALLHSAAVAAGRHSIERHGTQKSAQQVGTASHVMAHRNKYTQK